MLLVLQYLLSVFIFVHQYPLLLLAALISPGVTTTVNDLITNPSQPSIEIHI